jgi:ketosteroid isomerase-like protein
MPLPPIRAIGGVMLVSILGGCAAMPVRPNHEQLVAQVTAAETAFAKTMADRDHAAFLTFIAEDAVFLGGKTALRGRIAVGDGWKRRYADPIAPFSWKPELVDVNGAGTLATSTGPVSTPDGSVVSHYYSTWRLDRDGHWRVVFDNGYDACACASPHGGR